MTTKMKGLFKGLRYISQIFDEDNKEQDIQIGFPTDVKHVAHIGWDGPSVESPSWMKEFTSPTGFQSAPLGPPGDCREDPEIKWVSQDSRRGTGAVDSPGRDPSEAPRSSRRHHSGERETNSNDSPKKKDSSTKSRQPRKNHSKDSSDGDSVRSNRDAPLSDSPSRNGLPDVPKKSRRKKSKESVNCGGSSRSKSKPANYGDNGPEIEEASSESQRGRLPSGININDDEEKERRVTSKEY